MTGLSYERIYNKRLERKLKWLLIVGFIKDVIIIGLVILGLIKIIGG